MLYSNISNDDERKQTEAVQIENYKEPIMNGCIDRAI